MSDSLKQLQAPRILVFDSGVGGLSIAQAISDQYPQPSLIYASDNAHFPYGTKSEAQLVDRVDSVLHRLQEATSAHIIVVACNSASTIALPKIRERFDIPIVGVVPAIKPAAKLSQSKVIGLLATPGTVTRHYTQDLINDFAKNCQVLPLGSSELVQLAENKLRGQKITSCQINNVVEPFLQHSTIDTMVLACTHFPLIKTELQRALPNISFWVDSGEAIARRVGYWLQELQLPMDAQPKHRCILTQQDPDIQALIPYLRTQGFETLEFFTEAL